MKDFMTYENFLKMMKMDLPPAPDKCPVTLVFDMLQGKWKNHILFEMGKHDSIRFGELKKALSSITNTMLTSTLRELETEGLINREQFNEIPPHVEYSLTEKSKDLMPIFYQMHIWGMKHLTEQVGNMEL